MDIRSTDKDDFKLVFDKNYSLLVDVAYHIVWDIDIAEDLSEEAFERFFMRNLTLPSEEDARYWLLRVVKNLALNYLRKNKRDIDLISSVKREAEISSDSGEGDVIREEERQEVRKAIESLPENLRLVIQLKEFTSLDYKAIGRILGISESNVKVRVHRARKKLEEILSKEYRDVY